MIVIGVDGTDIAKEALQYGLHEASIRGTRVRAVYAWMPSTMMPATGPGMVLPLDVTPYREAAEALLRSSVAAVAGENATTSASSSRSLLRARVDRQRARRGS